MRTQGKASDSVKQRLSCRAAARQPLHCETGYCKGTEMGGRREEEGEEEAGLKDRGEEEGGMK